MARTHYDAQVSAAEVWFKRKLGIATG